MFVLPKQSVKGDNTRDTVDSDRCHLLQYMAVPVPCVLEAFLHSQLAGGETSLRNQTGFPAPKAVACSNRISAECPGVKAVVSLAGRRVNT